MSRALGVVAIAACRFAPEAADAGGHTGSDAMGSAGPPPAYYAVGSAVGSARTSTCACVIEVPTDANNAVVGYVGIGSINGDAGVPTIDSVTLNGSAMKLLVSVLGTPSFPTLTRSAQYILTGATAGSAVMAVTLGAAGDSLHCDAMSFTGVDPHTPVRASAVGSGRAATASLAVASAVGDLVVNTVGQGNQIDNAVGSFDVEYLDNRSASTTLDNTAGGIVPGSASVTVAWDFGQADEFQTISSSLEPVH